MLNLNFHLIIATTLLCLAPLISKAQVVYEGQVINAANDEPLIKASVILLKKKQGTATNQQGYFRLIVNEAAENDTLAISFIGFKMYLLPVADYQPNIFIKLEPAINQLSQVNVGANVIKTVVLNKFNYADVRDLRGSKNFYVTLPYSNIGWFAKEFEAPKEGTTLTTIHLGRRIALDIPINPKDFPHASSNKLTRFLLHVMTADTLTSAPAKIIYSKEVTLNDNSLRITFDLSAEKITLPQKKFFVAIEWLLIPINEIIRLDIGQKVDKVKKDGSQRLADVSKYYIVYQPFLVRMPRMGAAPTWISSDGVVWNRMPKGREFALSTTVSY